MIAHIANMDVLLTAIAFGVDWIPLLVPDFQCVGTVGEFP